MTTEEGRSGIRFICGELQLSQIPADGPARLLKSKINAEESGDGSFANKAITEDYSNTQSPPSAGYFVMFIRHTFKTGR